jgi:hypothetical protein
MSVQALSVVVKIKPGQEGELRDVLREVGADPASNRYIRFGDGASTHLANWVILHDPENGFRLFFATNHDGNLASYTQELLRVGPGLEEIFGRCEGYEGRGRFHDFIERNSYPSQTFFAGFPDETVGRVHAKISIRKQVEYFLDLPDVAAFVNRRGLQKLLAEIERIAPPQTGFGWRSGLDRLRQALHEAFFGVVLALARWYGEHRVDRHCVSAASNLNQPQIAAGLSDADHMTNMIDVKPGYVWLLRLSLAFMEFLARYAFPPGELAGVKTIRFARWVLIDRGKRLLFQSRFDGTWENYMGDFVDNVGWGLDAIWSNTVDYPTAGMNDIDAFKRFIRDRQFEHLAVFEAYPDESVLNLMRNREICAALANRYDPESVRARLLLV